MFSICTFIFQSRFNDFAVAKWYSYNIDEQKMTNKIPGSRWMTNFLMRPCACVNMAFAGLQCRLWTSCGDLLRILVICWPLTSVVNTYPSACRTWRTSTRNHWPDTWEIICKLFTNIFYKNWWETFYSFLEIFWFPKLIGIFPTPGFLDLKFESSSFCRKKIFWTPFCEISKNTSAYCAPPFIFKSRVGNVVISPIIIRIDNKGSETLLKF